MIVPGGEEAGRVTAGAMGTTGGQETIRAISLAERERGSIHAKEKGRAGGMTIAVEEVPLLVLMDIPVLPAKMTRKRKESECRKTCIHMRIYSVIDIFFFRISPPSRARSAQPNKPLEPPKPVKEDLPKKPEPQAEIELEIPSTPPPVEDVIAARRAKRQAILAKYSGQASLNASPSPMPRNSAEPPPESPAVSANSPQPKEAKAPTSSEVQMNGNWRIHLLFKRTHELRCRQPRFAVKITRTH